MHPSSHPLHPMPNLSLQEATDFSLLRIISSLINETKSVDLCKHLSLCVLKEFHRIFVTLFWSNKVIGRSKHWASWEKECHPNKKVVQNLGLCLMSQKLCMQNSCGVSGLTRLYGQNLCGIIISRSKFLHLSNGEEVPRRGRTCWRIETVLNNI